MRIVDYIVRGQYVLPMDEAMSVLEDGAVAVEGGLIVDVGTHKEISARYKSRSVLGGGAKIVMPGFINTHTHAAMVYLRGLGADVPLKAWLEDHVWPTENKWMSAEFVHDAVELACLEMLKAGVTAFCDMYFFQDQAAEVATRMGLRATLTSGVVDFPTKTTTGAEDCLAKAEAQIERFKGDPLITTGIGLHATYTCGPETIRKAREIALRHNSFITIHLSETEWEVGEIKSRYGLSPVMHLHNLGLFEARTLASHCVWVSEEEIALMAKSGVSIAHCVESNMKLASGIAPVPAMLKAGLTVALGTDGAASNNDLDILGEMQSAALVHKAVTRDATVLGAKTAVKMATVNGAKALGLHNTGMLASGKAADLIVLDLSAPHAMPLYDAYAHLAYSAKSSDVETVMVGGKLLLKGGRLTSAQEEAGIRSRAARWAERIRAGGQAS